MFKYTIGLKTILKQGISSLFYGDLVYKFKRIVGKSPLPDQFKTISCAIKELDIT